MPNINDSRVPILSNIAVTSPSYAMQGYDAGNTAAGQGGNQGQVEEAPSRYQRFMAMNSEELLDYMRYTNMCNAICILVVGGLGIFTFASTFNFTILFIGVYTTIFGCLLFCLECRLSGVVKILRKYFGFMFSFAGRTFFLSESSSEFALGILL